MQGQAETGEPLRQDFHPPAGVGFQLEADDKIIGKTRHKAPALHPGGHVFDKPFGQDPMQEYLRHHGRDPSALRRTLVWVGQSSRLQYTSMEPLAKQSQYSPLTDPLLDTLPQMAPVEIVAKSTDIRVHDPGDVQRPTLLTQLVPRLVLTVPFAEAMGKPIKIVLEDGLQKHHHRSLDHFVLEAGFASWPLLPIFLLDPYPLDGRRQRAQRDHRGDDRRGKRHGSHGGCRAPGARVQRERRAAERAAVSVTRRGVDQVRTQDADEVVAHGAPPMRRRSEASPRETRWRTAASEVCSPPAISP